MSQSIIYLFIYFFFFFVLQSHFQQLLDLPMDGFSMTMKSKYIQGKLIHNFMRNRSDNHMQHIIPNLMNENRHIQVFNNGHSMLYKNIIFYDVPFFLL